MAQYGIASCFKYLIIYTSIFYTASCLVLGGQTKTSTIKPIVQQIKNSSTAAPSVSSLVSTSTVSPKATDGVALYRYVNSNTGTTCILFKTDAVAEVKFKLHDLEEQADSFIPEKALVDGDCDEDISSMRISWNGYSLLLSFSKTPGGERWYINQVELTVSPDLPQLKGVQTHGKAIKLYHKRMLIPTPVGKSYSCEELDIPLETELNDRAPTGLRGSLLLRLLQIQPFMYKNEDFEIPVECKTQKTFRDETAPIAVGSTLAVAVLMTVAGYGIFRYFKIKNVQYNTME